MSILTGKTVNIIVGKREPDSCAFVAGKLILLDRPKSLSFVAYVEEHIGWWESSKTDADAALKRLQTRLQNDGIEWNEPIYTLKPIVL